MSDTLNRFALQEWKNLQIPFQVSPHVYYVGTKYVGSFLIKTQKGLVLIDQGFAETVYLLFESIRILGFDPSQIKYLLISHCHHDHCGGTRLVHEYSNADVFMSKEDFSMKQNHPQWCYFDYQNWIDFSVDYYYNDQKVLDFGDIQIQTIHTPGHTPGTTSFVFKDYDRKGRQYVCALHGGLGVNTLIPEFYSDYPGWPVELVSEYIASIDKLLPLQVDIPLPSHPYQLPILSKAGTYREGVENPFIVHQGWQDMLKGYRAQAVLLEKVE